MERESAPQGQGRIALQQAWLRRAKPYRWDSVAVPPTVIGASTNNHKRERESEQSMKILYQLRGVNPHTVTDRPLDQHLEHLDHLIPISSAHVVLEHQRNVAPAFSASVDLAVPGPDIHAAARDHTLEAAVLKVARRLEAQIESRKTRQQLRLKRRETNRSVASQWSRGA
jgi:ribosome-associated translation inhibitor RaiA